MLELTPGVEERAAFLNIQQRRIQAKHLIADESIEIIPVQLVSEHSLREREV